MSECCHRDTFLYFLSSKHILKPPSTCKMTNFNRIIKMNIYLIYFTNLIKPSHKILPFLSKQCCILSPISQKIPFWVSIKWTVVALIAIQPAQSSNYLLIPSLFCSASLHIRQHKKQSYAVKLFIQCTADISQRKLHSNISANTSEDSFSEGDRKHKHNLL